MTTQEIIKKVLKQLSDGQVEIESLDNSSWTFITKLSSNIEGTFSGGHNVPILQIPNFELFIEKIEHYLEVAQKFYKRDQDYFDLDDDAFKEKLFFNLLTNAGYYDFENIYNFIDEKTEMLQHPFPSGVFTIGKFFDLDLVVCIAKNHSNWEAPYKLTFEFQNENKRRFVLPAISFGKTNSGIVIASVQNLYGKHTDPFAKKMDRFFRKINKDVNMSDLEGNVSPNALVALVLFLEFTKEQKFTAPNYSPLRYSTNQAAGLNRSKTEEEKLIFLEQHDKNQFNITNKFMHLFLRYNFHFPESELFYDENSQTMELKLHNVQHKSDHLIYELPKTISKSINELKPENSLNI